MGSRTLLQTIGKASCATCMTNEIIAIESRFLGDPVREDGNGRAWREALRGAASKREPAKSDASG